MCVKFSRNWANTYSVFFNSAALNYTSCRKCCRVREKEIFYCYEFFICYVPACELKCLSFHFSWWFISVFWYLSILFLFTFLNSIFWVTFDKLYMLILKWFYKKIRVQILKTVWNLWWVNFLNLDILGSAYVFFGTCYLFLLQNSSTCLFFCIYFSLKLVLLTLGMADTPAHPMYHSGLVYLIVH